MVAGLSLFVLIHMIYVVSMSLNSALLRFWFKTDLGRKNSASYLTIQAVKTFSYHGHSLVVLYVQFLCSDFSKIDRWVYAENLCSILKLVNFDSWSWQSFESTCDFLTTFFHWMYNELQLLSRVFCYSWLVCLLGFGWEIRRLSKSEIRFRMASFLFFTLLDA